MNRRWPMIVLVAAILLFVIGFTWLLDARYRTFFSHDWRDEAVNNQILYNTAHGQPLRSTIKGDMIFHMHFRPMFLPLALPYMFHGGPISFYFTVALLLGLAALAAFMLGEDLFGDRRLALLAGLLWLLWPPVHELTLGNFDPETVAASFWLFAFVYFRRRYAWPFWLFAVLAMMCKETHAPILAALGVIALIERRRWTWWAIPIAVGSAWFVLALKVIIPLYHPAFATVYNRFVGVQSVDFWGEFVAGWQSNPTGMLAAMFSVEHLLLLGMILLAGGGMASLSPVTLLGAGPTSLMIMMLRDPLPVRQAHILAGIVPFAFAATLIGLARLNRWLKSRWPQTKKTPLVPAALGLLLAISIYSAFQPGPFGEQRTYGKQDYMPASLFDPAWYRQTEQSRAGWRLVSRIDPKASAMTNERFLLALSSRRELYEFGNQGPNLEAYLNVDWILLGLTEPHCITCVYARLTPASLRIAAELIRQGLFVVEAAEDRVVLLRRATRPGDQLSSGEVEAIVARLEEMAVQKEAEAQPEH